MWIVSLSDIIPILTGRETAVLRAMHGNQTVLRGSK